MQAKGLVVRELGDWRDLEVGTLDLPPLGPHDILVEVEAASLNFPDLLLVEGKYQVRPVVPFIVGRDAAGIAVACGESVVRVRPGDRVAVQALHGALADRMVVSEDRAARLPDGLSFAAGAAAATVFATAHVALDLRAQLRQGERVLVTGAAGGVGTALLQLCRLRGGVPIALVSSAEKEAFARSQGAEAVVRSDEIENLRDDLKRALLARGLDGVDVVADVVGGDAFDAGLRVLRSEGRMLVIGFTSGRIPEMRANYALLKNVAVVGSPLEHYLKISGEAVMRELERILSDIPPSQIESIVTDRLPLSDFRLAAERLAERRVLGKQVLWVKPSR